jgi:transcriptional regulator with XRE-family HTH domain
VAEKRKPVPNLKLISLRINAGLSPAQLGRRIAVSAPTIRQVEAGHIPQARVQRAIAGYFELDALDLFPLDKQKELI